MAEVKVVVAGAPSGLTRLLRQAPAIQVLREVGAPAEAPAACDQARPAVLLLDATHAPREALAATEAIMAFRPLPILVLTAEGAEVFRAAGAIEVLTVPPGGLSDPAWARRVAETLRLVSRLRVITHPRARLGRPERPAQPLGDYRALAVGASTGGPGALATLVGALGADFPLPVLVVLHLGDTFGPSFATWLGSGCALPVREAVSGEPLPSRGCVLIAPPDRHLTLQGGSVKLSEGPSRHGCRPSVDVLFESVAQALGARAIGCLLTGMGKDGAAGLLAMRRAGALTLAQDEASSVVYGMPREAARLGAASRVLPLERIGPTLSALAKGGRDESAGADPRR